MAGLWQLGINRKVSAQVPRQRKVPAVTGDGQGYRGLYSP